MGEGIPQRCGLIIVLCFSITKAGTSGIEADEKFRIIRGRDPSSNPGQEDLYNQHYN